PLRLQPAISGRNRRREDDIAVVVTDSGVSPRRYTQRGDCTNDGRPVFVVAERLKRVPRRPPAQEAFDKPCQPVAATVPRETLEVAVGSCPAWFAETLIEHDAKERRWEGFGHGTGMDGRQMMSPGDAARPQRRLHENVGSGIELAPIG